MSRNSQKDRVEELPNNGWDVESLDSENEDKDKESTLTRNNLDSTTNVKKATGKGDGDERKNSVGDLRVSEYFSRKLFRLFSNRTTTPPGGRVTPKNDDAPGPSPVRKAFSKKSEEIAMKQMTDSKDSVKEISPSKTREQNVSRYCNPAYIPSYNEEENDFENDFGSRQRRSYEAPIYSVNSAGHPVPITIEESENEEEEMESYSRYERTGREIREDTRESSLPTASRLFTQDGCCCCAPLPDPLPQSAKVKVRSVWRKTYKPDSPGIFCWLCVVTAAYLFNLWTIPLRATFTSEIQSSWQDIWFACDALCDLVNVIDIFIKFRTCYIKSGVYISDIVHLNRYHRREWTLILDILSIVPTDLFFLQSINPYFRLNRLLKIHRVLFFYQRGELSTWSPNFWRTLNLIHLYGVIIHYHACFYYDMSESNGFGQLLTSWPHPDPKLFPDYTALYRRYTYSFYWCLVSLGVIGDRYFPETDGQFLFSIYLHLLGVVMMIFLIAFVTVMMFDKGVAKFDFEKTMRNTRAYMKQRKLPKDLRQRILRFYQYCWVNEQFPHLDENKMLCYLPSSIRKEIELHSNLTALKQIPSLSRCDSELMRELVMKLKRSIYLPGQFVYKNGDLGTEMFIVAEGLLQVVRDGDPSIYSLREGDVFGEIDLLNTSTKRRTADVVSYGYSELYTLSCEDVTNTLNKYPKFMNMVHQQEKRRQNIVQKECRAYGAKYQALSTTSIRSQTDSKVSASRVHFNVSNGDIRRTHSLRDSSRDESPDSGMPSTPSVGQSSNSETPMNMTLPNESMKPELIEKLSNMHHEHVKALRSTLDGVLYQEVSYLQQRLDDTERERDMKSREITQLRRQLAKQRNPDISLQGDEASKNIAKESASQEVNSKRKENDAIKVVSKTPKKVIRSVQKKSIGAETKDVFASSTSFGKV